MSTLVERLLAAIEQRKALAEAAAAVAPAWEATGSTLGTAEPHDYAKLAHGIGHGADQVIEHVAASDPESVLRRCAADQRIVDLYLTELRVSRENVSHLVGAPRIWGQGKLSGVRIAVLLLAEGYGFETGEGDETFRLLGEPIGELS